MYVLLYTFPFGGNVEKPKRAVEITIKISADTTMDAKYALEDIYDKTAAEINPGAMGSPSCGYSVQVERNLGITPEKYQGDLSRYLEWQKTQMTTDGPA